VFATRLFWSAYLAYHLRGQARYPFKPLAAIRRDQARRVRAMVSYAYRNVPYYRETMDRLDVRPADFQSAEDLSKLPLLEREQLQNDPERFVSTAQPLEGYFPLSSGGSTGAPSKVYYDSSALFQNAAHGERTRSMTTALIGRGFGYRETVIAMHHSSAQVVQQFLRDHALFPSGMRAQRQYLSVLDPSEKNVRLINEHQPDAIRGFGSALGLLFGYVHATGTPLHLPKVVTYHADAMSPTVRHLIENEFNIPVFSTYGAVEAFNIGFECEHHQGYHLNIDLYPVRIVDAEGREVPEGEGGEVVVSNLLSRGTVLFNYRLSDLSAISPDRCPCGRSLPLLSFLHGRTDDLIELPSGEIAHPLTLKVIFCWDEPDLWEFQVIQETPTHFRVPIIASETCDREEMRRRITTKMTRALGGDITAEIDFVDSLGRTGSGKLRTVISKVTRTHPEPSFLTKRIG
jgi:phenylacetate-CoA ligase